MRYPRCSNFYGNAGGSLRLDDVVKHHVEKVLRITKGKIHGRGGAAELLGVNPSTLRNRMKKLGIRYKRGSRLSKSD
jgi:transcriptional regulator with GAF, ATPase, and Fis domain